MLRKVVTVMAGLCLMLSIRGRCGAAEQSPPVDPQQGDYVSVTKFADAVSVLKAQLAKSPVPYSTLVSEERVRRAIQTSLQGQERMYEKTVRDAQDDKTRRQAHRAAKHFQDDVKPIYEEILQKQTWPARAFFLCSEGRGALSSLSVQLHVEIKHPYEIGRGMKATGDALQILRVTFGDAGRAEKNSVLHLKSLGDKGIQ